MRARWSSCRARAAVVAAGLATLLGSTPAAAEQFYFRLELNGGAGGDADGSAHGTLSIDSETGRIVWGLYYDGIASPSAMHIHRGHAGESGAVVVPLNVESELGEGALTGSVTAQLDMVAEILAAPDGFYLNIHNGDFRGGALRAQLGNEWGEG